MALSLRSLVLLSLFVIRLTYFPDNGAKSNSSRCGNAHTNVSLWRMTPHLRPKLHRCRLHTLPNGFWLLLLAGDVELNPGPVRFPVLCAKNQLSVTNDEYSVLFATIGLMRNVEVSLLKSM